MTENARKSVTEALRNWIVEGNKERSQAALARRTGVSQAMISLIYNGKHMNGKSPIGDVHYYRLAEVLNLALDGKATGIHWHTEAFRRIQRVCKKAQENSISACIDGGTGIGKTYALEYYAKHNDYVLYIKATQSMRKRDLLNLIIQRLNIRPQATGEKALMDAIREKVIGDEKWLIILDETELVKHEIYFAIKEIIDFTRERAGVVMAGMKILSKMDAMALRDRPGIPQLLRRVGPHTMELNPLSREEIIGCAAEVGIEDPKVMTWLCSMAKDMDALQAYVKDILREVEASGKPADMDMIRKLFFG